MAKKKTGFCITKSTFNQIVTDYQTSGKLANLHASLMAAGLPSNLAYGAYGKYKVHPHQFRVSGCTLKQVSNTLISKLPLAPTFTDFEELFAWVDKSIRGKTPLLQHTCLLTYDIALRYGFSLTPQILPDKYVYILAEGPRKGLKAYCTRMHISVPRKKKGYLVPSSFLLSE